ncbi:hypothetical protein B0H34DRAFT_665462 [Crassisporium funariophilum]|nr:hypothetical protein B0H34DRAFT_665462 [Crassisporium funariophilum]
MKAQERAPFSIPLYALTQLLTYLALIPGVPTSIRTSLFLVVSYTSYHLITHTSTRDPAADVGLGSAILTQVMIAADLLFLTPNHAFEVQEKQKVTLGRRLACAFEVYTNPRGIPRAPSSPHSTSRWRFVRTRLTRALLCILLECLAYALNASNPGLTTTHRLLSASPLRWRALGVLGFSAAGYARIEAMHCVVSAVVVGCGLQEEGRWPNLFGRVRDGWSVKRFWRRVWHQLLRKSLISCTTFATTHILRMPPSPRSSHFPTIQKLIWLSTAFTVTALVHTAGEYMLCGRLGWGAFIFFAVQAGGIGFEEGVHFLWTRYHRQVPVEKGERVGVKTGGHARDADATKRPEVWVKCVGYFWVLAWFVWSLAFMIDPMVGEGMFVDPRVDVRRWVPTR